MKFKATLFDVR